MKQCPWSTNTPLAWAGGVSMLEMFFLDQPWPISDKKSIVSSNIWANTSKWVDSSYTNIKKNKITFLNTQKVTLKYNINLKKWMLKCCFMRCIERKEKCITYQFLLRKRKSLPWKIWFIFFFILCKERKCIRCKWGLNILLQVIV